MGNNKAHKRKAGPSRKAEPKKKKGDDIILHRKEDFTRKLIDFYQSADYKTNIPKSVAFLHIKDKQAKKETRETVLFTMSKRADALA